ncbi:MAG: 4-(cytidine 5'-diphospho)-2-C-methyl-D-erythritol kinase [Clostridia bacterium]|nr:4-(cytidine 5'-diphospho)-2-C-methyl-D-erythritol kinase [Clostridia bacterium]
MQKLAIECRAKINLAIDVIGKRENGYHDVEMIMQEIGLADKLELKLRKDGKITISTDVSFIPVNEENLAYRAAKVFFERLGRDEGVDIHIEKKIPMGAGLGGGSADAAGVLKGLNAMFGNPFEKSTLMELGTKLGADVPFCVMGGCALAAGIGEKLTPLPMPPVMKCVIAKPEPSVSTKWVYENLDYTQKPIGLNVTAVAEAIKNGDMFGLSQNAGNILENVTIPAYPVVGWIKQGLAEAGAVLSLMSGSGSAVFGLFENMEQAETGADMARRYTEQVYIV